MFFKIRNVSVKVIFFPLCVLALYPSPQFACYFLPSTYLLLELLEISNECRLECYTQGDKVVFRDPNYQRDALSGPN